MLDVSPVRAFSDNYIWLIHAPGDRRRVTVVDPGDARAVESVLASQGLTLDAILVTHHHPDHVGGVAELASRHSVRVLGPAREQMPCAVEPVDEGDVVRLDGPGLEFAVLAVPGHTLGHVAFHGHGALFCGDTLFSAGCGRLFEGSPQQMFDSLQRLAVLPRETGVYCAHEYTLANLRFACAVEPGEPQLAAELERVRGIRDADGRTVPSTIGRELEINPFLRCGSPSLRAAAERHCGRELGSPAEVFAAVRAWKDSFS